MVVRKEKTIVVKISLLTTDYRLRLTADYLNTEKINIQNLLMMDTKLSNTYQSDANRLYQTTVKEGATHKKVVIAGGGTGGHIYPAIGIAQALQRLDATVDIVFIGGRDGLESKLIPQHDFRFMPISVAGFPRRLTLQWFPVLWKTFHGLLQSLHYMKKLKPDIVIGTGGYVSGPVLFAGILCRIPVAIQEQNASVGLTNGYLARWAKMAYLAMESVRNTHAFRHTKSVQITGNPIRPAIATFRKSEATYQKFELSPERKTIFVMGGSQGAHAINDAIVAALPSLLAYADQLQIVHQTGAAEAETIQAVYQDKLGSHPEFRWCVQPFFDTIEEIYSIADVMVCRAGGMTVAEVTACGIPAIFIPLPSQTGNDQVLNAHVVAEKGGAVVLEQGMLTVEALVQHLVNIVLDEDTHKSMVAASQTLGKPHASDHIATAILSFT